MLPAIGIRNAYLPLFLFLKVVKSLPLYGDAVIGIDTIDDLLDKRVDILDFLYTKYKVVGSPNELHGCNGSA